jgi:hypothetical protein
MPWLGIVVALITSHLGPLLAQQEVLINPAVGELYEVDPIAEVSSWFKQFGTPGLIALGILLLLGRGLTWLVSNADNLEKVRGWWPMSSGHQQKSEHMDIPDLSPSSDATTDRRQNISIQAHGDLSGLVNFGTIQGDVQNQSHPPQTPPSQEGDISESL